MNAFGRLFWLIFLSFLPIAALAETHVSSGSSSLAGVQGRYAGLMYETNGIVHRHAGYFSITLSRSGRLTGFLFVGGHGFELGHDFAPFVDDNGSVKIYLFRGDFFDFHQLYTLNLQFDLTNGTDQVTGTLDNSHFDHGDQIPPTWSAAVLGDRDTFNSRTNPAPQAGKYTLVLPGGDGVNEPAGAGFATLRVDSSGNVRLNGVLADGTPIFETTTLAKDGRFPIYDSLYCGRGSLIGWVSFADLTDSDLSGTLLWTRPRNSFAFSYPDGFTNQVEAVGSLFNASRNLGQVLNFTNGIATFSDAGLQSPVADTFEIRPPNRVINTSGNRFSLSFATSLGTFHGVFAEPNSGRKRSFQGAYLQKQSKGYGYFLGSNGQSGLVTLEQED